MFGLTKREQRWKAEQAALEVLAPMFAAVAGNANASRLPAQTWEAKYHEMRERAEKAESELADVRRGYEKWKRSAESVGAELAAIKARMKPCARVTDGEVRAFMDPDDEGKYVAVLVVEE